MSDATNADDLVIEVDIRTRIVEPDEDFFVLRPGDGHRFYEFFERTKNVFLDFPSLPIDFRSKDPPPVSELRDMVALSNAVAAWHSGGREEAEPSRNLEDYEGTSNGVLMGRYVSAIRRFYYDLEPGTILVVPGKGAFSDLLIGELIGTPSKIRGVPGYPNESTPARQINWLGRIRMGKISPELDAVLHTAGPLIQLPRSAREEILRVAFDQYVLGGVFTARFHTESADFSTLDEYNVSTLLNYVAGALAAVELNPDGLEHLNLDAAISLLSRHRDLTPELATSINSPGWIRLLATRTSPLAIAVVYNVAISAVGTSGSPPQINVLNSAAKAGDVCAVTVQAQSEGAMKLMHKDEWLRICEHAQSAKRDVGLRSSMTVKASHHHTRARKPLI